MRQMRGEKIIEIIIRLSEKIEKATTREQYEIAEKIKCLTNVYVKVFKESEKTGVN